MPSLHIFNDADTTADRHSSTRDMPGPLTRIGCADVVAFGRALRSLWSVGSRFDRIAIDTHGGAGKISFGKDTVTTDWWKHAQTNAETALGTNGGHLLFSGCNVAETDAGWRFLTEAGRCIFKGVAGRVTGWTSIGFANPISGHTLHLWGNVRTVFLAADGNVVEYFEK